MMRRAALAAVLLVGASACSGGGSSDDPTADPTTTVAPEGTTTETVPFEFPEPEVGIGLENEVTPGGTIPPTADYEQVTDLSAECTEGVSLLREFLEQNPNPFELDDTGWAAWQAAKNVAISIGDDGTEGPCTWAEWAQIETSEVSPWATGQLATRS